MEHSVIKSIEFIDANTEALEEFSTSVRKKGFSVYQAGDRKLFSLDESSEKIEAFLDELENHAFSFDLDYAKGRLVYINKATNAIENSQKVMEDYGKREGIQNIEAGVPIGEVPDLVEYIQNHQEEAKQEETNLFDQSDVDQQTAEKITEQEEKPAEASSDWEDDAFEEDEDFIDDVDPLADATENENDPFEEKQEEPSQEEDSQEKTGSDSDGRQQQDDEVANTTEANAEEQNAVDDSENYPTADYLTEKAIALFDSAEHERLPQFDELSHQFLQEQILDSQFRVNEARDRSINKIYHRLKDETDRSAKRIETEGIKTARERHENTLETIERNLNIDIKKLLSDREDQYMQDRENFVNAQIPILRQQYDAEHYQEHQKVLDTEIDKLRANASRELQEENERFQEFVNGVFDDNREQVIKDVELDDIIDEYNSVAREQRDILKVDAKKAKEEIGNSLREVVNERNALENQLKAKENEIEEHKEHVQEEVDEGVQSGIEAKEEELVKENQAKLDEAYQRETELKQQVEFLQGQLESQDEEPEEVPEQTIDPADDDEGGMSTESPDGKQDPSQAYGIPMQPRKPTIFQKASFGLACGFLLVFGIGTYFLNDIRNEMSTQNDLEESSYLAQLESGERYEKTASEMERLGYSDHDIAEMYLEHGKYLLALEQDQKVLPDVYEFLESDPDSELDRLNNIKNNDVVAKNQQHGLDVRIAIASEDTDELKELATKTKNKATKRAEIEYFIEKNELDSADELLKDIPDQDLNDQFKVAQKKDLDNRIANAEGQIDDLNSQIGDKNKAIEDQDKKIDDLNNDIDDIKDSDDDKDDKDDKISDKEDDIDKANEQKDSLSSELEDIQKNKSDKESELEELNNL